MRVFKTQASRALLLQNAKCKMQRSESRASSHTRMLCRATHAFNESQMQKSERRDGEKHVLSPMGLTLPENRVLRPFWARFSLGLVVCTAEGTNGDSEAILWRFRGHPSRASPPAPLRGEGRALVVLLLRAWADEASPPAPLRGEGRRG